MVIPFVSELPKNISRCYYRNFLLNLHASRLPSLSHRYPATVQKLLEEGYHEMKKIVIKDGKLYMWTGPDLLNWCMENQMQLYLVLVPVLPEQIDSILPSDWLEQLVPPELRGNFI